MSFRRIKRSLKNIIKVENRVSQSTNLGPILDKISSSTYGDAYSVIAHGGGGTQNEMKYSHLYTNSLAAIIDSIADGKKLIEIDLAVTSDNEIVGVHSWPELKAAMSYNGEVRALLQDDSPLTYEEVRGFEFNPGTRSVNIHEINKLFLENEDLVLVVDKIKNIPLLMKKFNYPNRMILEVFNVSSFDLAVQLGVENIAFNINIKEKNIVDWLVKNKIPAVTFSAHAIDVNKIAYDNAIAIKNLGIVSLAYTSNDDKFIKNNIGVTVSAVYTDFWSLNSKQSITNGENITY